MTGSVTRRSFLGVATFGAAAAIGWSRAGRASERDAADFPHQPADEVMDVVRRSHFDLDGVSERVRARPALAKASWDWGFGDWESALGAASHMGRGDIADVLLAHGARPNLFSAAMLGQVDVVRSYVQAAPGIQSTLGPHGLTLLHHARSGGDGATDVVEYLESVGGADPTMDGIDLTAEQLLVYAGIYEFGSAPDERIVVSEKEGTLRLERVNAIPRQLRPVDEHTFAPMGAEAVRIRFAVSNGSASRLDVHDPDVILSALRVEES